MILNTSTNKTVNVLGQTQLLVFYRLTTVITVI